MPSLILIIEDEPDLVDALEYTLRREAFYTRVARTGRAGLACCREDPGPDLVLLDLMLPDMSGIEVCRTIRADERTRELPVIIMSAKAEELELEAGFEAGADDYVVKPFSLRELTLRCRALLRRRAGEPP